MTSSSLRSPPSEFVVSGPYRPAKQTRRLLSIGHSYVVGMNRRLAHEMTRVGGSAWEVTAVAPKYFSGNDLRPVRLELNPDEPCRVVALNAYCTRSIHTFLYGLQLKSLLSERWDVVHCWEEPYVFAGGEVAWWTKSGAALVFRTAQSMNKKYPPPFRWIERYAMQKAAGWVCSGSLVEQTLATRCGYDKPMARIPLGVDMQAFYPDWDAGRAVLRKLGWAPGPAVIGYLGRFVPDKGLDLLMRALDRLGGEWRAMFVGAGPMQRQLRNWAAKHGDRVRLCTNVTHAHVPAYLNAMTVLCAPSQTMPNWKEQFGRMIVEAFAVGLPIIGSDSGEIPFVINNAGVVVGEKNEEGWTRAIEELITSPDQRRDLAGRGLQRVKGEFSWPVVARKHLDFFETLLSSRVE